MSASDKPTIEGFVDRLLEENHIKVKETVTVTNMLKKATDGMTADERATVIRSLNEKLDATSGDLITPQGLNFASFENAVETAKITIVKEKQIKIEDEIKKIQDLEEISIKEDFDVKKIDDLLKGLKDIDSSMLSEEFKQKVAKAKVRNDKYAKKYTNAIINQGKKKYGLNFSYKKLTEKEEEQLQEEALKETLGEDYVEKINKDGPAKVEMLAEVFSEISEEAVNQNKTEEEVAEEFLKKDKSFRTVALKFCWKKDKEFKGLSFFKWMKLQCKIEIIKEEETVMMSHARKLEEYDDGTLKSIAELKGIIDEREKVKRGFRRDKKKCNELARRILYPEVEKKNEELYNEIVEKYIMTGRTISDIYEEYRIKGKIGDLEFEDILDGVKANLESDVNKYVGMQDIYSFIKHEKECRNLDLLITEYEKIEASSAIKSENMILNNNLKIKQYKDKLSKERQDEFEDKNFRKQLSKRRNLDYKKTYIPKIGKVIEEVKDLPSSKEMLEKVNAIIEDRNKIISIAEHEGISVDEAFQKYLDENEDFLDTYTEEEKKLMGITGEGLKNTDFITRITSVLNGNMYATVESLNYELRMANQKYGWLQGEECRAFFKEIKILEEKLSATKDNQKRLEVDDRQQLSIIYSRIEEKEKYNTFPIIAEDMNVSRSVSEKIQSTQINKFVQSLGITNTDMEDALNELLALPKSKETSERSDGQDENENLKKSKSTDDALVQ